jgi:hypothetical protein
VDARRLAIVVVALASLFTAACVAFLLTTGGTQPAKADAQRPGQASCAKALLHDWSDGRIDGSYPVRCYREALKSLPTDLEVYSSAPEDITQALSRRISERAARHTSARRVASTR